MTSALRRIWDGGGKTTLIAAVVALLVGSATVVAGSPFLKKKAFKKNEGIYAVTKDGPVSVPTGAAGTMASIELSKGKYAISARLYGEVVELDTLNPVVTCRLESSRVLDEVKDFVNGFAAIPLQATVRLSSPATVTLNCVSAGTNDIEARSIKVTAVRAKKLRVASG